VLSILLGASIGSTWIFYFGVGVSKATVWIINYITESKGYGSNVAKLKSSGDGGLLKLLYFGKTGAFNNNI
jgi:hypothetical protein